MYQILLDFCLISFRLRNEFFLLRYKVYSLTQHTAFSFVIAFQMFKGFEKLKDVQYIYTPFDSSLCGVKLEANSQKQYLLTGKLKTNKQP